MLITITYSTVKIFIQNFTKKSVNWTYEIVKSILYYHPRAFPTRSADFSTYLNSGHLFLAWGTLSTQGIVILSGVVCCCWRCCWRWRWRCCRHKSCPHPKFENRRRYRLTFFLIDWYEWGGVQSKKKFCAPRGNSPRETCFCLFASQILSPPKI